MTGLSYVKGDINNDNKIGLQETIYSLQVTAGLVIPPSGTIINVPGDVPTIQQAIDAASDGDTINIAAGAYPEALAITGKMLILRGAGAGTTIIDGNTAHVIHIDRSPGVLVEDLTLQNGDDGIYATNHSSVRINRVTVQNCSDRGIQIDEHSQAEITDSTIRDSGRDGIGVLINSSVTIAGTVTTRDNSGSGLMGWMGASVIINGSTFTSSGNGGDGIYIGQTSGLWADISGITLQTNSASGLSIDQTSSGRLRSNATLTVEDSGVCGINILGNSWLRTDGAVTIRRSQEIGLYAADSCAVQTRGAVLIANSGSVGFGLARSSAARIYDRLEVLDSGESGISVFRGSSFQNTDTANIIAQRTQGVGIDVFENSTMRARGGTFLVENNSMGGFHAGGNASILMTDSGAGLNATIRNNSGDGIAVNRNGAFETGSGTSITGNTGNGITFSGDSLGKIDSTTIENNTGWGIDAWDGSSIVVSNSTIQGNNGSGDEINLSFGARSNLSNNTMGSGLTCDDSVLSIGLPVCP